MSIPAYVLQGREKMDESAKNETVDSMRFPIEKKTEEEAPSKFPFGCFAGGLLYIADDFDATPEEFKEYM